MGHIERRQKEKEEIKQRIIDAARKIASNEGWHALTIRKIAEEIEYTPPIVYEHFENKEDLIQELIYTGFGILGKKFANARQSESDPRKLLKMMSMIHWDFAFANTELYQLMFSLERPTPNEDMMSDIKLIESIFFELAENDKELSYELFFSWICLINGAISIMMKFPDSPHQNNKAPRDIFKSIINRFIDKL